MALRIRKRFKIWFDLITKIIFKRWAERGEPAHCVFPGGHYKLVYHVSDLLKRKKTCSRPRSEEAHNKILERNQSD